MSHKGLQFLTHLFERFDKDKDRALSPTEFEQLFATCPTPPWPDPSMAVIVPTNRKGWITLQGYLCRWAFMTLLDLPKTFAYLAYLGYNIYENENQLTAIQGFSFLIIIITFKLIQQFFSSFSYKRKKVGFGQEAVESQCLSMSCDWSERCWQIVFLSQFYQIDSFK